MKAFQRVITRGLVIFFLSGLLASANSASINLLPAVSNPVISDSTATLELFMDFTDEATLGGGIDLLVSGAASFIEFVPSTYFNGLDDAFTGFGTDLADGDFEIHFGDFVGLDGRNKLGDVLLSLDSLGMATVGISINSSFEGFFSAVTLDPQAVALNGAELDIQPIPVPAAVWLFGSALGLLAGVRRQFS